MKGSNEDKNSVSSKDKKIDVESVKNDVFNKINEKHKIVGQHTARGKFKKGNTLGVRFGAGQKNEGAGRPKNGTSVMAEMKLALETYGLSSASIAHAMVELSLDERIDPKHRIAYMKEVNMRVFGQPKGSIEDSLKQINERVDKLYELTMPLLEATAISDGKGIIKELMAQNKLEEVINQIKSESLDKDIPISECSVDTSTETEV